MSALHATLVDIAHKRLDRADQMLRERGACADVLEAYAYTVQAFRWAGLQLWALVATERAERTLALL